MGSLETRTLWRAFRFAVIRLWFQVAQTPEPKGRVTWTAYERLARNAGYRLSAIVHPYPEQRLCV